MIRREVPHSGKKACGLDLNRNLPFLEELQFYTCEDDAPEIQSMLEVTVIPDSAVADIFASKCCGGGLPDQNLEIRIVNQGGAAVVLQSRFRLEGAGGHLDWNAVCPAGGRRIVPGDVAALYADLDPALLDRFQWIVLFDDHDRAYRFPLAGGAEIPEAVGKGSTP